MKSASLVLPGLALLVSGAVAAHAQAPASRSLPRAASAIRLRFVDTDVSDVLQALARKTGANIVYPAQLKKPISVSTTAPTVEDAIRYITAAAGLAYRRVDSTYVVAAPENLRAALEPFGRTVRLPVSGVPTDDAVKLLEGALPYVTVRPAGTQVIVTGPPADLEQAALILSEESTLRANAVAGAAREYRIYDIKYSSAPILQDLLTKAIPTIAVLIGPESYAPPTPNFRPLGGVTLGSTSGSSGSGTGSSTGSSGAFGGSTSGTSTTTAPRVGDRAKTLILSGMSSDLDAAVKLLDSTDIAPHQVMVDVKVVDTSPERIESLGLQYGTNGVIGTTTFFEGGPGTTVSGFGGTTRTPGFSQFSRVPFSFQVALNALFTNSQTKLLADPRIQVTDNDEASIFIGQTIRTAISQSNITGTTLQVEEFPVGIVLLVRPRVNSEGRITMHIHPVVSTVTGFTSGLPQTSSREAETNVMVKDGETIVIGGLISDQDTKAVQEVPFLSKIPIIGELFKNRTRDHLHSEVVVFITPHIVRP